MLVKSMPETGGGVRVGWSHANGTSVLHIVYSNILMQVLAV